MIVSGGGGKEEDAKQMLRATEYVNEIEMDKKDKKDRKNVTMKKILEIRIPDIMMSDEYVSAITEPDRKNARMIFVNSIFKYSRQLYDTVAKENENVTKNRGADNNVVILDEYQIVLCSKNETIQNRFNEIKAMDQSSTSFLTLSDDVFGFELSDSSQTPQQQQLPDKNIILVNEWNDRGFIGDYGAYAYSDADASSSLTLNQRMISKSQQIVTESTPNKEAVTRVVPKYPNTAFLLNPIFSYHTLDPSRCEERYECSIGWSKAVVFRFQLWIVWITRSLYVFAAATTGVRIVWRTIWILWATTTWNKTAGIRIRIWIW
jgi:hypothetical protein